MKYQFNCDVSNNTTNVNNIADATDKNDFANNYWCMLMKIFVIMFLERVKFMVYNWWIHRRSNCSEC